VSLATGSAIDWQQYVPGVSAHLARDSELLTSPRDRSVLRRAVARALARDGVVAAPDMWAQLVRDLVDEIGGLGPLEVLLRDPHVTDVMVNGPDQVFVERDGVLAATGVRFRDENHLRHTVLRALPDTTGPFDQAHPAVDAVLPGGVRLHAVLPPLVDVTTVTLRRIAAVVPTWDDLIARGMLTGVVKQALCDAVQARKNIVVCGRSGVGKTTLLARLIAEAGNERVVLIEDTPELGQPSAHCVSLRTRTANTDGVGTVDVAWLLRNALRMRPDRLVIGEVRGVEVADLLQALNTGHDGSMVTVHANGVTDVLTRLEGMAVLAGVPLAAAHAQVTTAVDVVVSLAKDRDGQRYVAAFALRDDKNTFTTVWADER
jgi:pilus assembly protein CpaF